MYKRAKGRRYQGMTLVQILRAVLDNSGSIHTVINNNGDLHGYISMYHGSQPDQYKVVESIVGNYPEDCVEDTRRYTREECNLIDFDNMLSKRDNINFIFVSYEGEDMHEEDIDEDDIYSKDTLLNYIDNMHGFDHLSINLWISGRCDINIHQKNFSMVYVRDMETNHNFDGFRWCHGLDAYSFGQGPIESALGIQHNPQWEICCSREDEPIGPIGLYIEGDCKVYSNVDLYSEFDDTGRYFNIDSGRARGIVDHPDDIDAEAWDHSEAIVCNTKITGLWVKEWYNDPEGIIDTLELFLGVEAVKVKSRKE